MRLFNRQYGKFVSGANVGINSELYWMPPRPPRTTYAAADITRIVMARPIKGVRIRPRLENDTRNGLPRSYGAGAWNVNIVIDEQMRANKMGIPAPNMKPAVTAVAGGTITGAFVPYYRYVDGFTGRFGPLSTPGDLIDLGVTGTLQRSWNNLPQEVDVLDDSVTHAQGLVDDGSGVQRVVWTKEIGAPAVYVENTPTLSLGQAAPPAFQAMPTLRRVISYHDILAGFGNSQFPERLFISAIGEYEHWEGTYVSSNGEPVIAAFATDDVIIYGSFEKIYRTQGFVASDFGRRVEKPDIGFIAQDGFANVNGRIIAPTSVGIMLYDGSWHNLMKDDMESRWREQIQLHPTEYRDAQGFYDPESGVYTFGPVPYESLPNISQETAVFWVLDVRQLFPETGGDFVAKWSFDVYFRRHTTKALWTAPGTGVPIIAHGAEDGQIREENALGTPLPGLDDEGQTKQFIIEPAYLSAAEGGFPDDGAKWLVAWTYMESSDSAWDIYFRAGSSNAWRADLSEAHHDIMGSSYGLEHEGATTEPIALHQHLLASLTGMTGQILGQHIYMVNPADAVRYSGWGAKVAPGVNYRALVSGIPSVR
jgi:hypothetical protein